MIRFFFYANLAFATFNAVQLVTGNGNIIIAAVCGLNAYAAWTLRHAA